ncbi:MAG: esterase family protein [Ignavibacteriae bacterium]|nr:MAG: esterase family protein [Ignavibacteriota bacterium]
MILVLLLYSLFQAGPTDFEQFTARLKSMPAAERSKAVHQFIDGQPITPIIERDSIVGFYWLGKASVVAINGDLQHAWSRPDTMDAIPCGDDTLFVKSTIIPPDARLDYQFIINGKYFTDPRNPRIAPSGYGPHSEILMPKVKLSPALAPHPDVPKGTLDTLTFTSTDPSIKSRKLVVYKPAGYQHISELPSLYVHDGYDALKFAFYAEVLDYMIAEKKIQPVLAVFIPPVEREYEYVWGKYRQFRTAICNELVPLIDRLYKTSRLPQNRAMMGISNGGHISLISVLKRPDVFLCAAGQSATMTDQLSEVLDAAAGNKEGCASFRIYLDVGHYDLENGPEPDQSFLSTNRSFSRELDRYGINHVYHEFNDGHEWGNWRERTEEILIYFFSRK